MKDNSTKCLIATFAFGGYERFVPSFIYSIFHQCNYDDVGVVVFMPDNDLSREVKSWVNKNIPGSENIHFEEFKFNSKILEAFEGEESAKSVAYRWLTDLSKWHNYKFALILDVDILVLDDVKYITEFHLSRMNRLGLPFSNILRHPRKGKNFHGASKRLTGIHFLEIKPYFLSVTETLELFRKNPIKMVEVVGEPIIDDEVVLYSVCKKSFGFLDENLRAHDYERPWHGIHLGAFRGPRLSKKLLSMGTGDRQDLYMNMCEKLTLDPIFIDSIETFPTREKIFFFNSIIIRKSSKFKVLYGFFVTLYFSKKIFIHVLNWFKRID